MIKLYNDCDLKVIEKKKNITLFLLILCLSIFVIGLIVFLLISTYKTRLLFSVITSIFETTTILFALFFAFKFNYLKRIYVEYKTLQTTTYKKVHCEILKCSDFITTLPDRSRCYEVLVSIDDKEVIYYLSEIFNYKDIKEGKALILVASDYIVGYEYER